MANIARTAGEFFATRAERYDEQARLGLPGYDAMLDELTRSLPDDVVGQANRILELGCGTGALTSRLAGRFSEARIRAGSRLFESWGFSISPHMTTQVSTRI